MSSDNVARRPEHHDLALEQSRAVRESSPAPDAARIVVSTLVTIEDARAMLNVEPSLVKVIRRLSEH